MSIEIVEVVQRVKRTCNGCGTEEILDLAQIGNDTPEAEALRQRQSKWCRVSKEVFAPNNPQPMKLQGDACCATCAALAYTKLELPPEATQEPTVDLHSLQVNKPVQS